jgi:hypothetical protein
MGFRLLHFEGAVLVVCGDAPVDGGDGWVHGSKKAGRKSGQALDVVESPAYSMRMGSPEGAITPS